MYHSIYDLIDSVEEKTRRFVNDNMDLVPASDLGLDLRCGRLFVNEDGIAVSKDGDRSLQYYGGFEYVDKDYRNELGDYVFYTVDDDRVREHVEQYLEQEEVE
jgi:glutathione synthase/RimK-type ligase-like ATP-grasp enzyme